MSNEIRPAVYLRFSSSNPDVQALQRQLDELALRTKPEHSDTEPRKVEEGQK